MTPIVARPLKGKVRVQIPYRSDNRGLLREIVGPRRHLEWKKPYWLVSREAMPDVIEGLAREYGRVIVKQQGATQTTCVEECWTANPRTAHECECGCAGSNHGSGVPIGPEVQAGLSVGTTHTTWTYEVIG